jgi:16S rRNA (guanine527-N7)-methyltransferase
MRIEDFAQSPQRLKPDIVSARALAPLPRLFELAFPFFGSDTRGLFMKGHEAETEIEVAGREWSFDYRLHPSLTSAGASIVEVTRLHPRRS